MKKTPLPWLQLTREKTRLLIAIAGIAFSCILIFVQMGFEDALYTGSMRPQQHLKSDLVMVNPHFETFFAVRSFPRSRLYQVLAAEGVDHVTALRVGKGSWKNPVTRRSRDILVFGCDPLCFPFAIEGVDVSKLKLLNAIAFDIDSRKEFGPMDQLLKQGVVPVEVNNKAVKTVGSFALGASFAADGNMFASESTFLRLFPERRADEIDVGLIFLKPGYKPEQVQAALNSHIAPGVVILTRAEFAERERAYWANSSGIGFIFGLGVVVGFVVGVVIVYQILYADVSDHLSEYATLKAIGYDNSYLAKLVAQEALVLSVLGFIPGTLVAFVVYDVARAQTLLPINMTCERAVFVFALTIIMCVLSALVAIRKLREADPADIF